MTTAPVKCRKCDAVIPAEDVNVAEGAAFCRGCGTLSRLRDILDDAPLAQTDVEQVPHGCSVVDDGMCTRVRASLRSMGSAAAVFLFVGFWNSIVSIFVLIAIAETLQYCIGSIPSWFPSPSQSFNSANGGSFSGGSLGGLIFMWIFLTPFIVIGLGGIVVFLTTVGGRIEVRLHDEKGLVFTGFGPFGWKRRFNAMTVRSVRMGETSWQQNDKHLPQIQIETDRVIKFGSMLPEERRNWMAATLRKLLVK